MFYLQFPYGATDVQVPIMVIDDTDGTPETGYSDSSTGIDLWYRREGGAKVAITEAALASWSAAHADGGVEHGSDGRGRLDLPDAACAWGTDGARYVEYGGTISGMIVVGGIIQLQVPTVLTGLLSGTHSTSSADLGANAPGGDLKGSLLLFPTHEEWVFITSYNSGTGVASFDTVSGLSLSDDDPWVVIPLGFIDSATLAALNAEMDTALSDYDAATGTELAAVAAQVTTVDALLDALTAKLEGVEAAEAASGTLTTSDFTTNLTAPAANCYANRRVIFKDTASGCPSQVAWVESNTAGASSVLTLKSGYQLQNAPSNGDEFLLV